MRSTLDLLNEGVRSVGARLVVLVIPDELQIEGELLAEALEHAGIDREDIDLDRPQRALVRYFDSSEIRYLDVLPAMRRLYAEGVRLYKPRDTHWNEAGNEVAGRALAELVHSAALLGSPNDRATAARDGAP